MRHTQPSERRVSKGHEQNAQTGKAIKASTMIVANSIAVSSKTPAIATIPAPQNVAARFLAWIVAKDQAYRDVCHVETLTDDQLRDVGLTR